MTQEPGKSESLQGTEMKPALGMAGKALDARLNLERELDSDSEANHILKAETQMRWWAYLNSFASENIPTDNQYSVESLAEERFVQYSQLGPSGEILPDHTDTEQQAMLREGYEGIHRVFDTLSRVQVQAQGQERNLLSIENAYPIQNGIRDIVQGFQQDLNDSYQFLEADTYRKLIHDRVSAFYEETSKNNNFAQGYGPHEAIIMSMELAVAESLGDANVVTLILKDWEQRRENYEDRGGQEVVTEQNDVQTTNPVVEIGDQTALTEVRARLASLISQRQESIVVESATPKSEKEVVQTLSMPEEGVMDPHEKRMRELLEKFDGIEALREKYKISVEDLEDYLTTNDTVVHPDDLDSERPIGDLINRLEDRKNNDTLFRDILVLQSEFEKLSPEEQEKLLEKAVSLAGVEEYATMYSHGRAGIFAVIYAARQLQNRQEQMIDDIEATNPNIPVVIDAAVTPDTQPGGITTTENLSSPTQDTEPLSQGIQNQVALITTRAEVARMLQVLDVETLQFNDVDEADLVAQEIARLQQQQADLDQAITVITTAGQWDAKVETMTQTAVQDQLDADQVKVPELIQVLRKERLAASVEESFVSVVPEMIVKSSLNAAEYKGMVVKAREAMNGKSEAEVRTILAFMNAKYAELLPEGDAQPTEAQERQMREYQLAIMAWQEGMLPENTPQLEEKDYEAHIRATINAQEILLNKSSHADQIMVAMATMATEDQKRLASVMDPEAYAQAWAKVTQEGGINFQDFNPEEFVKTYKEHGIDASPEQIEAMNAAMPGVDFEKLLGLINAQREAINNPQAEILNVTPQEQAYLNQMAEKMKGISAKARAGLRSTITPERLKVAGIVAGGAVGLAGVLYGGFWLWWYMAAFEAMKKGLNAGNPL